MILDQIFSPEEITAFVDAIRQQIDIEFLTDQYRGQVFDYIDNDDNDLFNAIEAWCINHNLACEFERAADLLFLLSYDDSFAVADITSDFALPMCYMLSAHDERFLVSDTVRDAIRERINSSSDIRFSIDYFDSLSDELHNVVLRFPKQYSDVFIRNTFLNKEVRLRDILDYASTITDENDRKVIRLLLFNLFDTHEYNLKQVGIKSWINNLSNPDPLPEPWNDSTPSSTESPSVPALPLVLSTPKARKIWRLLQEKGYIDKDFRPNNELSNTQVAYIAHWMGVQLRFTSSVWATFSRFWNKNKDTMRTDYNKSMNQSSTTPIIDELNALASVL